MREHIIAVTGAASGIGAACCSLLRERGATVIGLDLNQPQSDTVDQYIAYDQGDPDTIDQAVAQVPNILTGLMNVAGVAPSNKFSATDVLRINFFGVRYLTEAIRPKLNSGASVVNMTSGTGAGWMGNVTALDEFMALTDVADIGAFVEKNGIVNEGLGNSAAYPFSKQLLSLWTLQVASQWREQGYRVNAVAPAAVDTPIVDDFLASFGTEAAERMAKFGAATPENIARASVFLLGEDAAWVNGAVLPVDGGAIAAGTLAKLGLV